MAQRATTWISNDETARSRVARFADTGPGHRLLWLAANAHRREDTARTAHGRVPARCLPDSGRPAYEDRPLSVTDRPEVGARVWRGLAGAIALATSQAVHFQTSNAVDQPGAVAIGSVVDISAASPSAVPDDAPSIAVMGALAVGGFLKLGQDAARVDRAVGTHADRTSADQMLVNYFTAVRGRTPYASLPFDAGLAQLKADASGCSDLVPHTFSPSAEMASGITD